MILRRYTRRPTYRQRIKGTATRLILGGAIALLLFLYFTHGGGTHQ